MRRLVALLIVAVPVLVLAQPPKPSAATATLTTETGPQIGHMVFFKLKESSKENRAKLVVSCDTHLGGHEGVVYYSAGAIADGFKREVNVRDWDVALHLVFADKAAHDKYQDHPRHLKFIEENKATWDTVRVFDSEVTPKAK